MKKTLTFLMLSAILSFGYSQNTNESSASSSFESKVMNTDRGSYTRSASNIAKGLQVELGLGYDWVNSNNDTYKNDIFSPFKGKLRLGLSSKVEIDFAINNNQMVVRRWDGSSTDKYNYWSPLEIGIRTQLMNSKKKSATKAALYLGLGVNTTQRSAFEDDGTARPWVLVDRPSYVTPEFALFVGHKIGSRFDLAYNFGLKWTGIVLDDAVSAKNPDIFYTIRATVHAAKCLDLYLEHFNFMRKVYYSNLGLNLGARYAINKKFAVDINAGLGLNSASSDGFAGLGLSYKLGK
ncbi:MAG: transporter [Chitinophagales bacterium]|nr:transporter [Chitinophagales bacterium]